MAVVDDQGRLFGRLNLIDAAVALLVFALIPLAYGSWMLFRTREPVIESVTPAAITAGQPNQRIEVKGRNLRPFLRAWVGTVQAGYLFQDADRGEVQVPALPPGTYDLALFDSKEIARFPNAVTVRPAQPENLVEVQLTVRYVTRPEVVDEASRSVREPSAGDRHPTTRPVLVSLQVTDTVLGSTAGDVIQGRLQVVKCIVRVMAARTADGWQFDGRPLRVGAGFHLIGETYQLLDGSILTFSLMDAPR